MRTRAEKIAYHQARRDAFVARGLRSDGKPHVPVKPCGCHSGSCLKCGGRKNLPPDLVKAMYADYTAGMSLAGLGRKYHRSRRGLTMIFQRRGLALRVATYALPARDENGRIKKYSPATPEQIHTYISRLKFVAVPKELKLEWRRQPMAWRVALVRQIRATLNPGQEMPTTPLSSNVTPWEYGTPAAMKLAARMNRGRDSRNKVVSIRAASQGLIYQGRLFFWTPHRTCNEGVGYLAAGQTDKVLLHHLIFTQHHGPIPAKHTVIFRDGNKNNFVPENLALRSQADCARMNQVFLRLRREPNNLKLQAAGRRIAEALVKGRVDKSRRKTAALLQSFNRGPQNSTLLTTLKGAR